MDLPVHPNGMFVYGFIGVYGLGILITPCVLDFALYDLKAPWRHILFPIIGLLKEMRFTLCSIILQIISIIIFVATLLLFNCDLVIDKVKLYSLYGDILGAISIFYLLYFIFYRVYYHLKKRRNLYK